MKIFMATSFFLGILFLFLAARGFRKTRGWFGARRLLADVVEVEYQDVWEKKDVISEAASRIRVTLQFFCDERRIVRDREYQGILRTSFRRGDKVPVFYDPETGQWIPRGEVRWNWLWQLLVALFFLFLALCAVLDGSGMAAQISDSGRLGPSLTGRTIYLFGGVLFILAGLACARWLVPACFSPILSLIRWKLQEGAGGLEELDGQCMGLIRQKDAENDDHYYPVFLYYGPEGRERWNCEEVVAENEYQQGKYYRIYRERETGHLRLKPTGVDLFGAIVFIIPFLVCAVFAISLLGFGANLIFSAVIGVW